MPVDDVPPQGLIHRIELHSVGHIRVWRAYAVDRIYSIFLVHAESSRFSFGVPACAVIKNLLGEVGEHGMLYDIQYLTPGLAVNANLLVGRVGISASLFGFGIRIRRTYPRRSYFDNDLP